MSVIPVYRCEDCGAGVPAPNVTVRADGLLACPKHSDCWGACHVRRWKERARVNEYLDGAGGRARVWAHPARRLWVTTIPFAPVSGVKS